MKFVNVEKIRTVSYLDSSLHEWVQPGLDLPYVHA
jgi:hypothetical protein